MTGSFSSFVGAAYGSVHSGEGHQFNIYVQAAEHLLNERARGRNRSIAEADRQRLHERFVSPPGLQHARNRLRNERTVLVDGLPGSGRRTAALMLLHELPETRGSLHELPDTTDDETALPLDPADVNPGDRLLLDLSEAEESRYVAVQGALSDFRATVIERGAHLAVVLPHHLSYLLRGDLRHLTAETRRPNARRVLATHLRVEGILPLDEELGDPELAAYLMRVPIADVAALAERVGRCRNTSTADRGFPDWLTESLAEQHDQRGRVAADLSAAGGRHRALLLSLAMFHDTTPDVVLRGANALLGVLSHPPDPTPRLDRADLHAELSAIHADSGPDGRIRFSLVGYDRAVRNHFWTYLPDIRRELRDWLSTQVADLSVAPSVRIQAVDRFADQAFRTGRPEDLVWLTDRWMSSRAPGHLVPPAAQALAIGLNNDRFGQFFRQRIYDWATSQETSDALRQVLVVVCSQTMAHSHPDQALVRLHHVSRRTGGSTLASAGRAVLTLSRSDDRLYQKMLDRLSAGIASGQWSADFALFRDLADPVRLMRHGDVRRLLALGWSGLLGRPVTEWAGTAERWLTVGEDVKNREPVTDVLASACGEDHTAAGRLYRVALGWQRAERSIRRVDTLSCLLLKLDAAQGIEPYSAVA
ncbi:hypothetical protein [Streptomyces sp. NPDC006012]|uniref:hypothetical protein n=1 Tax=Streptomyces sp. NPDC006012 TaxID=3364739 RepID=UPI0036881929